MYAEYYHYSAHALNLVLVHASKTSCCPQRDRHCKENNIFSIYQQQEENYFEMCCKPT